MITDRNPQLVFGALNQYHVNDNVTLAVVWHPLTGWANLIWLNNITIYINNNSSNNNDDDDTNSDILPITTVQIEL